MVDNTIRMLVKGVYDLQKLRIATGLRLVATYKSEHGQEPGEKETELDAEAQKLIKEMRAEHKRITDAIAESPRRAPFPESALISSSAQYALADTYFTLEGQETNLFKEIQRQVEKHIAFPFVENVKGFGPAMFGCVLAYVDIEICDTVSKLWAYCGLDVAKDGRGRGRYAEHLVEREYVDRDGVVQMKMGLTYSPFLKTKMAEVLASSLLRAGGDYAEVYRNYKHRLENNPKHQEKTKAHRHRMAMRYMTKILLKDLWLYWREAEGLAVRQPYSVDKLGLNPHEPGA